MLSFICYNYEITYKNEVFKQIKGVPMGAQFAPAFAIIFMSHIERSALAKLNFVPMIFKRYIDDVILGPIEFDQKIFQHTIETFNSINKYIQFSLDVRKPDEWLPFLDIKLKVVDDKVQYSWYQKPSHSKIMLRKDSFLPPHVKSNFIKNRMINIKNRCNDDFYLKESLSKFSEILKTNGYTDRDFRLKNYKRNRKQENPKDKCLFKVPFISSKCNKEIRKAIDKYNLPVKMVNEFGKQSATQLSNKSENNICTCDICSQLNKYSCKDRFVVYKYTCKRCNEFYVGKTVRKFSVRHNEHRRAINNKSISSALYEHLKMKHNDTGDIGDFEVCLIAKLSNTRDTTFSESKAITQLQPSINRKHELPLYNLSSHFNHLTFDRQHSS